jgi:hypothetical protein
VALVSAHVRVIVRALTRATILVHVHAMPVFTPAQAVFKVHALVFFLFLQVKNQANQLNMQTKLSYRYFDYKSHNP